MTRRAWGIVGVAIATLSSAGPLAQQRVGPRSCVAIYDVARARTTMTDEKACRTRLSPASTFKIPHALVALETKVVTTDTVERWDGTPHQGRPSWERDYTILTAIRPSVLWFFQRIAPRVGADRMHGWLVRLGYGNADTSGPITEYWVNGRLRISPEEQLAFLRRFYGGQLPFSSEHVSSVQSALEQSPGTVQNSTGPHSLDGDWRAGITLSSKTGATQIASGERVSWLVGKLSVDTRQYVFAAARWQANGAVDPLDGTRLAIHTFIQRGVLPRTSRRP
jgi:beta-lactamase class D